MNIFGVINERKAEIPEGPGLSEHWELQTSGRTGRQHVLARAAETCVPSE